MNLICFCIHVQNKNQFLKCSMCIFLKRTFWKFHLIQTFSWVLEKSHLPLFIDGDHNWHLQCDESLKSHKSCLDSLICYFKISISFLRQLPYQSPNNLKLHSIRNHFHHGTSLIPLLTWKYNSSIMFQTQ